MTYKRDARPSGCGGTSGRAGQTKAGAFVYRNSTPPPVFGQPSPSWQLDKWRADRYWHAIASLLEGQGYAEPTATTRDLDWAGVDIVAGDCRIAWRCRDAKYLKWRDITIRKSRPTGAKTELQKLQGGACDRLLWTWVADGEIVEYLLLDVDRMQTLLCQESEPVHMPDADFVPISWRDLNEAGAILSCSAGVRCYLN